MDIQLQLEESLYACPSLPDVLDNCSYNQLHTRRCITEDTMTCSVENEVVWGSDKQPEATGPFGTGT